MQPEMPELLLFCGWQRLERGGLAGKASHWKRGARRASVLLLILPAGQCGQDLTSPRGKKEESLAAVSG